MFGRASLLIPLKEERNLIVNYKFAVPIDQSKTTTGRPSPPWQITSQPPPVWSTISPTVRPPPPPPKISAITTWSPARPTTGSSAGGVGSSPTPAATTVQPPAAPVATIATGVALPAAADAAAAAGHDQHEKAGDVDYIDEDLPKRMDEFPEIQPHSPLPQSPQHDLPELEIEKKAEKGLQDEITTVVSSTSMPMNKITGKYCMFMLCIDSMCSFVQLVFR